MTKNFKGGYKIVSLNGNDLASGDSFVVNGLYENLVNSYKKPILVTEIVIDGEKQQDSFAVVKQSDGGYTIDVYGYALTVTSEDAVSIVEVAQVTSIGGVSGDITLGTGLTITEDGELSAESGGGSKWYLHNYQSPQSTISTLQVVSRVSTLATNLKEFILVIMNATYFGYYNNTGHEMLGCGSFVNAPQMTPFNPTEFFITALDKTSNTLVTTTLSAFSSSSYNSIKEWE